MWTNTVDVINESLDFYSRQVVSSKSIRKQSIAVVVAAYCKSWVNEASVPDTDTDNPSVLLFYILLQFVLELVQFDSFQLSRFMWQLLSSQTSVLSSNVKQHNAAPWRIRGRGGGTATQFRCGNFSQLTQLSTQRKHRIYTSNVLIANNTGLIIKILTAFKYGMIQLKARL